MRNIITKLKQGFIKENQSYINITLFLIIATGFVIRFAGIFSGLRQSLPFYANIDETTVTRIAFFMIKNGDFNPHNFLYPAFPIYIQVLWQVLAYLFFVGAGKGVPEFENTGYPFPIFYLTGRFLISIMGTALIYLTYRLAKDLFNRKVGLLAAALLAITFAQVWVSQYITSDTPMMFFGLLSLIFSTKILKGDQSWKNYLWSGIFLGLAVASRYNGYVFAVPLIFAYVSSSSFRLKYFPYFSLKHVREIIISIMAMIGAFLAAAPYTIINLPKFLADYGGQVTAYKTGIYLNVSNGDGMANWIWYIRYAATSGLYYPLFILSVFGFIIGLILLNKNKMFIFSYLIAHIFLILNMNTRTDRNLTQMTPYLAILSSLFIFWIFKKTSLLKSKMQRSVIQSIMVVLLVVLFSISLVRIVLYDASINKLDTRFQAGIWIKENIKSSAQLFVVGDDLFPMVDKLNQLEFGNVVRTKNISEELLSQIATISGEKYVVVDTADCNFGRNYYKAINRSAWSYDNLRAGQMFDGCQKAEKEFLQVKEISDPLFKNNFFGSHDLEHSSTLTVWHNPTILIYHVPAQKDTK